MPQAERRNVVSPTEVVVSEPLHFFPVIFDAFVGVQNSRDEGEFQAFSCQASSLVGDFLWDLPDCGGEVLQISGALVGGADDFVIQCRVGEYGF